MKLVFLFVDSFNIDHDLFTKIIELSNKVISGEYTREDILKEYQEMNFSSPEGFKNRKTVLRK